MSDINHSDTSNQRCHKSFEPVRMSSGLISTKMKICNDGKCAQCLHDHDGHGSQNCQHRIQISIRILAHQPKNEDQCAGKQCLGKRSNVRRPMYLVGTTNRAAKDCEKFFSAQGKAVPGGAVVECHATCKGAGNQQDLEYDHCPVTQKNPCRGEKYFRSGCRVLCQPYRLGGPRSGDGHPRNECVKRTNADDRNHGGLGNYFLRVSRFLTIHGGRFKSDPGPEGKKQTNPRCSLGNSFGCLECIDGVDGLPGHALCAASMK